MRRISLLVLVAVALAACGQKPGVSELPTGLEGIGALPSGATIDPQTGNILDAQSNVIGNTSSGVTAANGSVDGIAEVPGSTASGSTESDQPSNDGSAPEVGRDSTGVSDSRITIGGHAPLTGAAPIPSDSAQKGNDLYYKWLEKQHEPTNGRFVDAILKNDNYNPSQAVAVCKELVEKDHVFLLYGYAGTDQIQACARYAASAGVPYLSAGVTEVGLSDLPNYFAISLSYAEQGDLLADFLVSDLGATNEANGMIRFDTPNFEDAHQAFIEAMNKRKAKVVYDRAVPKTAGQAEAQAVVQEMKAQGLENVYVLTSPVWFIQLLQAARTQDFAPQWVGVGITKALDTVSSVGCRNGTINAAKFFSPFPAWAEIDRFDPDFKKAVGAVYPDKGGGDDFMIIGWGMGKIVAALLDRAGRGLTRQGFVSSTEHARDVKTGVFPPVSFSPDDHFGGSQVHLNEAQCSGYKAGDNRWHTIRSFVSDF